MCGGRQRYPDRPRFWSRNDIAYTGKDAELSLSPLSEVARNEMSRPDFAYCGLFDFASLFSVRTARVKPAARRRRDRARHIAGQNDALALRVRVGHGHRREQGFGVRMLRIGEE